MRPSVLCLPAVLALACTGPEPTTPGATTSTTGAPTTGTPDPTTVDPTTTDPTTTDPTTTVASTTTDPTTTVAPTTGTTDPLVCEPMSVAPCYTGPVNSEGVGPCHAGTQTCAADGAGFGACEGEVVPGVEDCTTPDDEDCDGLTPLCPGAAYWVKRFGEAETQTPRQMYAAPDGTSVLIGSAQGAIDFGLGPLVSAGDHDMFLAKFDADGAPQWARMFGSAENQSGTALAVDGAGRIVATGTLHNTVDFGGGPLIETGYADAYLAVFTAEGEHVWSKDFGDESHQFGDAVAVTPADEIVLLGTASGMIDFGGGPLVSAGGPDVYLAKFGPDGSHLWSKLFGDSGPQENATGVAVQATGDIVVTGYFDGTIDFGNGPLVADAKPDIYLATLGPGGAPVWSRRIGGPDYQYVHGLALDPASGNIAISGQFRGATDFGGGPIVSAGEFDAFVAVFTADGAHVWSRHFGDAAPQLATSVEFAPGGDILLTGSFQGTIDLGGGPLVSAGAQDPYLARFTADGEHVRSDRFGGASSEGSAHVAADAAGGVFITGSFLGALTIDGVDLSNHGEADIFYARLAY